LGARTDLRFQGVEEERGEVLDLAALLLVARARADPLEVAERRDSLRAVDFEGSVGRERRSYKVHQRLRCPHVKETSPSVGWRWFLTQLEAMALVLNSASGDGASSQLSFRGWR